jgi:hypothetical protein
VRDDDFKIPSYVTGIFPDDKAIRARAVGHSVIFISLYKWLIHTMSNLNQRNEIIHEME